LARIGFHQDKSDNQPVAFRLYNRYSQ